MKLNKLVAVCLITAAVGLVIGGIGFVAGGRVYGLSLGNKGVIVRSNKDVEEGSDKYIEKELDLQPFKSLDMKTSFTNVRLQESDHYGMDYCVRAEQDIEMKMEGDKLVLRQNHHTGEISLLSLGDPDFDDLPNHVYVTLYVPRGEKFSDITMDNDSGDIRIEKLQADKVTIQDDFGNVTIHELETENGNLSIESGDLTLDDVKGGKCRLDTSFGNIAIGTASLKGNFTAEVESGDIDIDDMEADSIVLNTSFGQIEGRKITANKISSDTESGDCTIEDISCADMKMYSQFGSIDLGLREGVESYTQNLKTDFGEIEVSGEEMGTRYKNSLEGSGKTVKAICESGDITIYDAEVK